MLLIQSLASFGKNLLFLEKKLFLLHKTKTRQNKELKYRRKNIVWTGLKSLSAP